MARHGLDRSDQSCFVGFQKRTLNRDMEWLLRPIYIKWNFILVTSQTLINKLLTHYHFYFQQNSNLMVMHLHCQSMSRLRGCKRNKSIPHEEPLLSTDSISSPFSSSLFAPLSFWCSFKRTHFSRSQQSGRKRRRRRWSRPAIILHSECRNWPCLRQLQPQCPSTISR